MPGLTLTPLMERMSIQKTLSIEQWRPTEPFAWAQNELLKEIERQYNLGLPVRIIVLKGRQLGISTISEAVLLNWCFLHPGSRSLVIAHETRASQHLFGMTKTMWEHWPFRSLFTEKHATAKLLAWEETGSSMAIATARNAGSGRSFTYHAVHCSECAFWDTAERLMTGLNQSVHYKPNTIIIIESTANGVGGWYYDEWQRAIAKSSMFIPLFFPWYRHAEYDFPNTTLTYNDLDKDEREILHDFEDKGMTLGKLAWRRHCIINDCLGDTKKFRQEFPLTPQEAFLTTGTNIFPLQKLDKCYHPMHGIQGMLLNNNGRIEFSKTINGPLTIFKLPGPKTKIKSKYVVAGDPSRTTYGDFACIQVLNRYTLEQVAVWRGHIDPIPFAHKIIELGYYYNTALVNVEMEGPGYGSVAVLLEQGYPNVWRHRWADKLPGKVATTFGWSMNRQRKHWAADHTINVISQGHLKIHDESTYNEMRDYVILAGGEMGPASERGNDDTVTSMMIAIVSTMTEPPLKYTKDDDKPIVHDLFNTPPWEATQLAAIQSIRRGA